MLISIEASDKVKTSDGEVEPVVTLRIDPEGHPDIEVVLDVGWLVISLDEFTALGRCIKNLAHEVVDAFNQIGMKELASVLKMSEQERQDMERAKAATGNLVQLSVALKKADEAAANFESQLGEARRFVADIVYVKKPPVR